ncbi:MAG: alginate lyase family protein, partial [Planctomycetaceae bacterium]|nr:alginate lyase family protein [Planctomycetaceae bacterium]
HFAAWDAAATLSPVSIADRLEDGVFRFFEHRDINLGRPPDWHRHPVTGKRYSVDRHWSEISDFAAGDIKYVWEPSRFAWVYPLVRAYWRTADERYPQLFWELIESWRHGNPPQQGVNWKCGQEVALRTMACCFGLYGFAHSSATTPERTALLAHVLGVSGERIEANLSYAVSQQNNHGITEAAGLWTLGLLFPEFSAATRWVDLGRTALERQCRTLIDDDGVFSQYSVNYQRVMLHACVWAIRLGDVHHRPLSDQLCERVSRAATFLWKLQDDLTGRLPRLGANDSALVLPLTNCEPQDYRSVIQTTAWMHSQTRRFAGGPWDEESLWLYGPEALAGDSSESARGDVRTPIAGYCVLRADNGQVVTRAGDYRYRPSQADMLHVDIWWRGENVALDAGTFTYNAPAPWDSPLARTDVHNAVTVDGRDQMERHGRFLWLPWLHGRQTEVRYSPRGQFTYWEGRHDGYERLPSPVTYRRGILRIGREHWLIVDALQSTAPHTYRLHWLLPDMPHLFDDTAHRLHLQMDAGRYDVCVASTAELHSTCVRADPHGPRGWYAPHYGDRQPALSWALIAAEANVRFWTLLGPSVSEMHVAADHLDVSTEAWSCRVAVDNATFPGDALIFQATMTGAFADDLHIVAPSSLPTR